MVLQAECSGNVCYGHGAVQRPLVVACVCCHGF